MNFVKLFSIIFLIGQLVFSQESQCVEVKYSEEIKLTKIVYDQGKEKDRLNEVVNSKIQEKTYSKLLDDKYYSSYQQLPKIDNSQSIEEGGVTYRVSIPLEHHFYDKKEKKHYELKFFPKKYLVFDTIKVNNWVITNKDSIINNFPVKLAKLSMNETRTNAWFYKDSELSNVGPYDYQIEDGIIILLQELVKSDEGEYIRVILNEGIEKREGDCGIKIPKVKKKQTISIEKYNKLIAKYRSKVKNYK